MTLTPNKTHTYGLPADQAQTLFAPHGYNCTSRSLGLDGSPTWKIGDFTFTRTWNRDWKGFQDEASFSYNNTAVNSDWPMIAGDRLCYDQTSLGTPLFDGTREYHQCLGGRRDLLQFKFNYNSSTLTLGQIWSCDASDRQHA